MLFGQIVSWIMLAFALVGALDRCLGCKFGPGKSFERGFMTMGSLALAMIGINTAVPLLTKYLLPLLMPVYEKTGIDPALAAGMLLANDCGGWPLALSMAQTDAVGRFSGCIVGSMLGCTLTFTLPFAFCAAPESREYMARGLLIGLIALPVGCGVGGLCMGISLPVLALHLLPLTAMALLLIAALRFFPRAAVKCVTGLGYVLTALITIFLAAAIVVRQLGLNAPMLVPFDESLTVVAGIAIVLTGAFTLLFFVERILKKPLSFLARKLNINETAVVGLLTSMVNSVPTFSSMKDMDERGAVINSAFAVCGSFVIGDHLAFTASTDISLIGPLLAGKLAGAALALLLALYLTRKPAATLQES